MKRTTATTGFTLTELVVVMLLIGILGVFVAPRLNLTTFRETGFYQQAFSAVRYAQKQAIASGCIVQVNIAGTNCNLNWVSCGSAGSSAITNPADNGVNFCQDSTPSANPANGSFRFDIIGRPMNNANVLLTAAQDVTIGSDTIRVEAQTGYAHAP